MKSNYCAGENRKVELIQFDTSAVIGEYNNIVNTLGIMITGKI
jgi:hypothetical protein